MPSEKNKNYMKIFYKIYNFILMKKFIKQTINKLGFDLRRVNPEVKQINFDDLLKDKINKNPIIFDIGGNQGQSIEKYLKILV